LPKAVIPRGEFKPGCLRRVLSAPDSLGEELVGLSEALDEDAGDCLVEGVLTGIGGVAEGGGADLDEG
jgi:hypothetical protein